MSTFDLACCIVWFGGRFIQTRVVEGGNDCETNQEIKVGGVFLFVEVLKSSERRFERLRVRRMGE